MQLVLNQDLPPRTELFDWQSHDSGSNWIEDPAWDGKSCHACAFRRCLTVGTRTKIRFHLSADQRYTLYLDGKRIGFGPERGDDYNWFYQTHELTLSAGEHRLVAVVWWTSAEQGLSHLGHFAHRPSLFVKAEGKMENELTTGKAVWQVMTLNGIHFSPPVARAYCGVGGRTDVDAAELQRNFAEGDDAAGDWKAAKKGSGAFLRAHMTNCFIPEKQLRHSTLPPMYEKIISAGKVRHAQKLETADDINELAFVSENDNAEIGRTFQQMLAGRGIAVLPANSTIRLLVDVGNYVCAWPLLTVSKGAKAYVRMDWAEALYNETKRSDKGNRDEIEGKYFFGMGDSLTCDGSENLTFEPFWWEAGRYLRILVQTGDEALEINSLKLRETHYPHQFESSFECDDSRWDHVMTISKRVLEMCSHESYFDCPYYEQLMYVGDTRLEVLTTYATTRDDRLPRKAITLFDESRDQTGLTRSRTPSIDIQIIPPFSMWWVMMVHDHAYWQNDLEFVKQRMGGVRAVLEKFRTGIREDGLLYGLQGWNFTDWVPTWTPGGIPPDGHCGANGTLNLQFAWVLRAAAELEDLLGEKELAARNRRTADSIAAAAKKYFWVASRKLFADNTAKTQFSEHAQCMAVLGGSVPKGVDMAPSLLEAPDLDRATIYFSHYLFETFRKLRKPEAIYDRLTLWFDHEKLGLMTTVEAPEPTRSDCHAWGAHPMFHAYATFAGIRPAAAGFSKVLITPQLGPLKKIKCSMVHPSGGTIELNIAKDKNGILHGTVSVPESVQASLVLSPEEPPYLWNGGQCKF